MVVILARRWNKDSALLCVYCWLVSTGVTSEGIVFISLASGSIVDRENGNMISSVSCAPWIAEVVRMRDLVD